MQAWFYILYGCLIIPISAFSLLCLFFLLWGQRARRDLPQPTREWEGEEWPFVTIQIPSFNDVVALRCAKHCLEQDYPEDRFEILLVDDSTDQDVRTRLRRFCEPYGDKLKYVHRPHRRGFKPGALQDAMSQTRGDIITILDADWIPDPGYLKVVVAPFAQPDVAIVQTRQAIYNKDASLVSRFATYLLWIYHDMIMPLHHRANSVFFCGTAGALRRSAMDEVGGWNTDSITEDADLTVRLLMAGYKTHYTPYDTPSEVPTKLRAFRKQQERWFSGNIRIFLEHTSTILGKSRLSWAQRLLITYVTMGSIIAPAVVMIAAVGLLSWFVPAPEGSLFLTWWAPAAHFIYSGGFLLLGAVMLWRRGAMKDLGYFTLTLFFIGPILAWVASISLAKALSAGPLDWVCTPKDDNRSPQQATTNEPAKAHARVEETVARATLQPQDTNSL